MASVTVGKEIMASVITAKVLRQIKLSPIHELDPVHLKKLIRIHNTDERNP